MDKVTLIIVVLKGLLDVLTRDEDKNGTPDVIDLLAAIGNQAKKHNQPSAK